MLCLQPSKFEEFYFFKEFYICTHHSKLQRAISLQFLPPIDIDITIKITVFLNTSTPSTAILTGSDST